MDPVNVPAKLKVRSFTNVTDRRTDGRTTCNLNTALCTSASRGKNCSLYTR